MQKEILAEVYQHHHERGNRYGYLFCHGDRAPYLQKWIGRGKRVLDLGCRDGMLTRSFCFGNEVIGVDIDRQALEIVQRELKIQTMWLDLNVEWPFEPHYFDVIVACEILEHLYLMDSFLSKIQASLKPGGCFIGSVPNAFRMRNRFKFLWGREIEADPTHVRMFSHEKLKTVLGQYFSEVEIIPIQGKVLPFLPVSALLPRRLTRVFSKDLLWRAVR